MSPPPPVTRGDGATDSTSSTILTVDSLSKRCGSYWALRGASFSVRRGEILGLVGPNGSGKTTLFRCLAGVMPDSMGTVSANAHEVDPRDRKCHLYLVPDGIRPWPDQSVDWVLRFVAGLHGADHASRSRALISLGLEPLLGVRLRDLPAGDHRRVMLALGLLTPHPLLMLDEPFDGLDLRQTREAMRVLRAHVDEGRTLFLSMHQLTDAERICDRFVLLSGGHVVASGTIDELRDRAGLRDVGLEEVFLALT